MLVRCGLRALLGRSFSTTSAASVSAQALRYHENGAPEKVLRFVSLCLSPSLSLLLARALSGHTD